MGAFVAILGGVFTTCEHRDNTPEVDPGSTVKSPVQTKEQPQVGLPTTQLTLGSGVHLMIDLALTQPQREKGLGIFRIGSAHKTITAAPGSAIPQLRAR